MNENEDQEAAGEPQIPGLPAKDQAATTNINTTSTTTTIILNPVAAAADKIVVADILSTADQSPMIDEKSPRCSHSLVKSLTRQRLPSQERRISLQVPMIPGSSTHQLQQQQQQQLPPIPQLQSSIPASIILSATSSSSSSSPTSTSLNLSPMPRRGAAPKSLSSLGLCKAHSGFEITSKPINDRCKRAGLSAGRSVQTKSSTKCKSNIEACEASTAAGGCADQSSSSCGCCSSSEEGDSSDCNSSNDRLNLKISPSTSTTLKLKKHQSSQEPSSSHLPLSLVCVERDCWEASRLCCTKCLSSGPHEGHEAICVRTIEMQLFAESRGAKLAEFRQSIVSQFSTIQCQIASCEEILLKQFDAARASLEGQVKTLLSASPSLNEFTIAKGLKLWQALYQPEKSPMSDHASFITEQGQHVVNSIQSKTANLVTSQILFARKQTKLDAAFQQQLKSIEADLKAAEYGLSFRAKQALSALPNFVFTNPELENSNASSMKKFEFAERTEFVQIDSKTEEPHGRCLIFWRDGAYRIGYYQSGQSNGTCRMVWENGNVYEGRYLRDKKDGKGCFVKFEDNTSYFGDFKDDAKTGEGVEYYPNATHYRGSFKDWNSHGYGTLYSSDTGQPLKRGSWNAGRLTSELNY